MVPPHGTKPICKYLFLNEILGCKIQKQSRKEPRNTTEKVDQTSKIDLEKSETNEPWTVALGIVFATAKETVLDHTFREEYRVVIAEFHGVGPFRGTVIQADDEQVEVLGDEEEGNKHFCTVYSENFRLLSHANWGW